MGSSLRPRTGLSLWADGALHRQGGPLAATFRPDWTWLPGTAQHHNRNESVSREHIDGK